MKKPSKKSVPKKASKKNYIVTKFMDRQVLESKMIKITKSSKMRAEIVNVIKNGVFYDLSDLGNEIDIIIGKYTNLSKRSKERDWKLGYDKEIFIHGIEHGISLSDGTHG